MGYDVELVREIYDKALFLVKKKGGSFTSKDKKLYINYDQWEDDMTIFDLSLNLKGEVKKSKVVFKSTMGSPKTLVQGDGEWLTRLRQEEAKRK